MTTYKDSRRLSGDRTIEVETDYDWKELHRQSRIRRGLPATVKPEPAPDRNTMLARRLLAFTDGHSHGLTHCGMFRLLRKDVPFKYAGYETDYLRGHARGQDGRELNTRDVTG